MNHPEFQRWLGDDIMKQAPVLTRQRTEFKGRIHFSTERELNRYKQRNWILKMP